MKNIYETVVKQLLKKSNLAKELLYFVEKYGLSDKVKVVALDLQAGITPAFASVAEAHKELNVLYSQGTPWVTPLWDPNSQGLMGGKETGLERSDYHTLGKVKNQLLDFFDDDET